MWCRELEVEFWMGALQWVDLPKLTKATVGLYVFWFSSLTWWLMGSQWHMGYWCQVHIVTPFFDFSIFCDILWKMCLMFTLWFSSAIRSKFQCSIAAAATVGSITSGNFPWIDIIHLFEFITSSFSSKFLRQFNSMLLLNNKQTN